MSDIDGHETSLLESLYEKMSEWQGYIPTELGDANTEMEEFSGAIFVYSLVYSLVFQIGGCLDF